jgi:hypothetical protein
MRKKKEERGKSLRADGAGAAVADLAGAAGAGAGGLRQCFWCMVRVARVVEGGLKRLEST